MTDILSTAIVAVQKSEIICRLVQEQLIDSISKEDTSPVTIADFAVQAIVSIILEENYAEIPLVGEEDASLLRENETLCSQVCNIVQHVLPETSQEKILAAIDRGIHTGGPTGTFWVLDPIDGTKGFLRKEQYAIALGLITDGEIQLGVLGCPNLPADVQNPERDIGSLFYASKGNGAFRWHPDTPTAISVSEHPFRFCESFEKAHSSHSRAQHIADLVGITAEPIRMDSQCKYALVAQGQAAAYLRLTKEGYQEKIWDHTAGAIIITEAGGFLSDKEGRPLNFGLGRTLAANKGVIASFGHPFHHQLISACSQTEESASSQS